MAQRPRIEDVARLAGVSIATVSRALNKPEIVSHRTRDAVMRAIDATGYTQNFAAQNLRRMQSHTVLVLIPDVGSHYFPEILVGIETEASAHGYTILIGDTRREDAREAALLSFLQSGRADGALVVTGRLPGAMAGAPDALKVVSISEETGVPGIPHVGIDNRAAARMAVRHLIDLGHRRIAHVAGLPGNVMTEARIAGWRDAMAEAGLPVDPSWLIAGDFTIERGRRAGAALAKLSPRPTAVFCANDETALGLMSACRKAGLVCPEDLSVVGFDDISFAESTIPALTTVRQPRRAYGETAMRLLVRRMAGEVLRPADVPSLDAALIMRESCAALVERHTAVGTVRSSGGTDG